MRVHVISDMEGVSGIVKGPQTRGGARCTTRAAALHGGDQRRRPRRQGRGRDRDRRHGLPRRRQEWSFNSLVPDLLDPDCEFVVQEDWTEYTAFLEEGCDAALLVGMHAMAAPGAGVMNHTVSGRDYFNLRFNGTLVGETGIHAALCGTWGCPMLLVTGDDVACAEGRRSSGTGSRPWP